jgi:hypothetical protein
MVRFLLACALAGAIFSLVPVPGEAAIADLLRGEGFYSGPVFRRDGATEDFIKVEINGHTFTLLIDTGCYPTAISRERAEKAGLIAGRDLGPGGGFAGMADAHVNLAVVSSFRINGIELTASPVIMTTMRPHLNAGGVKFDGYLGLETLKRNHAVLGFDPALLFFQPQGPGASAGFDALLRSEGYARLPLATRESKYLFPMTFDGMPGNFVLDSGAIYTLIGASFADRAHLPAAGGHSYGIGVGGRVFTNLLVRPGAIAAGPVPVPAISVAASPAADVYISDDPSPLADGFVGFDLLGPLSPLLDAGHDCLYLRPLPH